MTRDTGHQSFPGLIMQRTIWIIAGESSGESYGARLATELRQVAPDLIIRGMGGEAMTAAGVDIMVDSSDLGVVGLVEVLRDLRTFRRIFRHLVQRATAERPDAVVLIDYPGFNLRLARRLHALGIKVVYYISPQVWAWGKKRIPKMAKIIDKMLVIFPFEPGVYKSTQLDVEFVGHPLLEILAEHRDPTISRDPNTILMLPGSRISEVDRLLPVMLKTGRLLARRRPQSRFVIALPREAVAEYVRSKMTAMAPVLADMPEIRVEAGTAREWLQRAAAGLAASGTVTVEAAILGLPLVVVYRLHWLTFRLVQLLVKIPHFTMVNLVAGGLVFEEFLQGAADPERLCSALENILPEGERRDGVMQGMARTVEMLGGRSQVCRRAALSVLSVIGSDTPASD